MSAVVVGFGLVNFPDALLLLRLNEIGFGVAEVILAYVTYNLVYALASFPAGALADRLPHSVVFGVGLLFFAVAYVGLGLTTDPVLAWMLIGVYGIFTACTDGVGKAWVSSLVGSGRQTTAQGYSGRQWTGDPCRRGVGRVVVGRRWTAAAADLGCGWGLLRGDADRPMGAATRRRAAFEAA